jgi:hypothetical protein
VLQVQEPKAHRVPKVPKVLMVLLVLLVRQERKDHKAPLVRKVLREQSVPLVQRVPLARLVVPYRSVSLQGFITHCQEAAAVTSHRFFKLCITHHFQ